MKKKTRKACRKIDAKFGLPKGFTEWRVEGKDGIMKISKERGEPKWK